jgi:hypothetical protein
MATRRKPARNTGREELVAYIHGIDPKGDVAHILVHQRERSVRFFGRLGAHQVSPSHSADLKKWVEEAESVWQLDEAIGIPRNCMNLPETLEKVEALNAKATDRKKKLEALHPLEAY